MKIVILGLTITSSWGNGHATTYRALIDALLKRGHQITFLEREQPWYAAHRDLCLKTHPFVKTYEDLDELAAHYREAVAEADAVMVGSYVPDGPRVIDWVYRHARGVTLFYDIDTPVTLAALNHGHCEYLKAEQMPLFDCYLSFTGGPLLNELEARWGCRKAEAFYCAVDPVKYHRAAHEVEWALGYLGTYSRDRQEALDELMLAPAAQFPQRRFAVAGAQYPLETAWPENLTHFKHLDPTQHPWFYCSQGFTLNITRAAMRSTGYSPSVRLFEAAACGVPIISDEWAGLSEFFTPGEEILVARNRRDVVEFLRDISAEERQQISQRARRRVLAAHTADHRALQLEQLLGYHDAPLPSATIAINQVL